MLPDVAAAGAAAPAFSFLRLFSFLQRCALIYSYVRLLQCSLLHIHYGNGGAMCVLQTVHVAVRPIRSIIQ